MNKIEANDPAAQSADIVADNLSQLRSLFPDAFAEGKVQFDTLRQLLGETVDEGEEKYGLIWHGKRRARQIALTPSTGTLRPFPNPDESVDWETTQNLMIEGDNLEVLKLLQKSYSGKVKMIYIDPPYNTGRDFVYPDNFRDSIGNYLELTGQIEGGVKMSSNTEASGRFHTDWLNMMYPRLKLARNLLRDDGVIFASIDVREVSRLRGIFDEIFGEENFVCDLIWQSRTSISDDQEISLNHNHTLIFSKRREALEFHGEPLDQTEYRNQDNDPRGPWKLVPLDANKPGGNTMYPIKNPKTGEDYWPPKGRSWAINPTEYQRLFDDHRIKFGTTDESAPKKKLFLKERLAAGETKTPSSLLMNAGTTKDGTEECTTLMGAKGVFDYPKPTALIERLIQYGTCIDGQSIVMDFFAGSGTTGHATWLRNAFDGKDRRFILVQLPEVLTSDDAGQKVAREFCLGLKKPALLTELTKERLRRSAKVVKQNHKDYKGDLGFRVFKLDTSNIRVWNPDADNIAKTLLDHHEHILDGRTEADIVYELLLKLGLDLCVPIESRTVAGKSVGAVGGGVLMLCLAEKISANEVESVAAGIVSWHKELSPAGDSTVVFRDSAFADDVAKTNMAAILAQNGLENVRSL